MLRARYSLTVSTLALLAASPALADSSEFLNISIPGIVDPTGVSADGSTVVGAYEPSGSGAHIFIWDAATQTYLDPGDLGGGSGIATGVSGNGSVVVGQSLDANSYTQAFYWTKSDGLVGMGFLPGAHNSQALAVSADGGTVVGEAQDTNGDWQSFRWTKSGGYQTLGNLGGTSYNLAAGVSADGSVIVGTSDNGSADEAYRWTQGGGLVGLGFYPGDTTSNGVGVSADGSVVVGTGLSTTAADSWIWKASTNSMTSIGNLGGDITEAMAISGDGKVVVGIANTDNTFGTATAFRWTDAGGIQSVADWLAASNVTLPSDIASLVEATGTNSDGSVVIGFAETTAADVEAFYAKVGGFLDPSTYNPTLAGAEGVPGLGYDILNLDFNGAHHRPLMESGMGDDGRCLWLTGDAATHDRDRSHEQLAELGGCFDIRGLRIGGAIGAASARQSLADDGTARYTGNYLYAEADYASSPDWIESLSGFYGWWDTHLVRGYFNGRVLNSSEGSPDAASWSLRVRVDRRDLTHIGSFSISPYLSYTHAAMDLDAYTETGGSFPAMFNAQHQNNDEARLGAGAQTKLADRFDLRLYAEGAQRLASSGGFVTGQVIGLYGFNLAGKNTPSTWLHGGADLDWHVFGTSVISASVAGATTGQDASVSGSLSWKMTF